jgi:hypothetical protein
MISTTLPPTGVPALPLAIPTDCFFRLTVDLQGKKVEVYTQPSGPAEHPDYAQRQEFGLGDTIPVVLDGREVGRIAVQEFLGY